MNPLSRLRVLLLFVVRGRQLLSLRSLLFGSAFAAGPLRREGAALLRGEAAAPPRKEAVAIQRRRAVPSFCAYALRLVAQKKGVALLRKRALLLFRA